MPTQHKAYTLAEILIVVTIIAVLGLSLLVGINPITQIFKGYDTRRRDDLNKIKIALENYYSDHECYPVFPIKDAQNRPSYSCGSEFLKPYLGAMPCDPNSHNPYVIYITPPDALCSSEFVVYAKILSVSANDANKIPGCPNTIAVHSSGISIDGIINGCSGDSSSNGEDGSCAKYYGCRNGSCVVLTQGLVPTCSPSFCDDPACSPIILPNGDELNCSTINPDSGTYTRQCVEP